MSRDWLVLDSGEFWLMTETEDPWLVVELANLAASFISALSRTEVNKFITAGKVDEEYVDDLRARLREYFGE